MTSVKSNTIKDSPKKELLRGDHEDIVITDYTVSFGLTWKDIIFLPFYRTSMYAYLIVVYLSVAIAIFVITFQPKADYYEKVIFPVATALDVLFLARTVLAILHRVYAEHRKRKIFAPDPAYLLIIDAITMIPLGPYCLLVNHFNWYDPFDYRIGSYYSFSLKLPRIVRLYFLYSRNNKDLARHPRTITLITHIMLSSLLILIFAAMFYTVYYYAPELEPTWAEQYQGMRRVNVSYTTPIICYMHAGGLFYKDSLTQISRHSTYDLTLMFVCIMVGYVCHNFFLSSHLIAIYVQLMRYKHFFEWRLQKVGHFIKQLLFDQSLQDSINTYYRTIWMTRGGFVEQPEIVQLFPMQLKTEVAMDLYFDAIRHTRIFRNLDESVKKEISLMFRTEVYIPGQLIFHKDKIKSKLIYVHSGIVEVMSNENHDSPVLSFSPGTVLGEVSCILPYMSTADIKSSTTCVAHVLRHRRMMRLIFRDPELGHVLHDIIQERIQYARKKLYRMRRLDSPISHIFWIKYRWRQIGRKVLTDPLCKYYCSRYLNLLVISSYYELKMHSICIRGQCSFVMDQDSGFRRFLDMFCLACVVIHCIISFHLIVFEGQIPPNVFALLTLFDLVYLLDIYFQAITAVRVHNVIITEPMDIVLHKFKQFRFLLDVFASLPYDYFALLIRASPYYVGLCRLPKYIKLIKIMEAFSAQEQALKFSTHTIKLLLIFAIHGFVILLCSCCMYMLACFDNHCGPNSWISLNKSRMRDAFGLNLEAPNFLVALIYTSSIYLQMKIHHIMPTHIIEIIAQFVIGVCGFYFLCLTIVQTTGAIALENYSRFLYIFNISFLESVFHERAEIRPYRNKVHEYTALQWSYSNAMCFNDISTLMNHSSKFVRHKVRQEFIVHSWRQSTLFAHMSDKFVENIADHSLLYVIPPGHTLQRPNHSSSNLYLILDGYCKVFSYAPEDNEKNVSFFYTKSDTFPIIGFFQNVDSFLHVRTYTTVKVLCLSYHNFLVCMKSMSVDGQIFRKALDAHLSMHKNLIMRIVHLPLLNYPQDPKEHKSLPKFDYKNENKELKWKKIQKDNIRIKIWKQLMRTYDPNGWGYLVYEIIHSAIIVVEILLLYLSLLRFVRLSYTYSVISILLLLSHIIDLFVRSHVHYFTTEGIRVTAPRATFFYYLNHSFFVDLISALPYERLQVFEIFRGRNPKNWMNVIFSLIVQPLKLYRVFSLLSIIRNTIGIQSHNVLLTISYTMAMFFFNFEMAAFALAFTCQIDDDWYWECPEDSWLHHIDNYKYWYEQDLLYIRTYFEVLKFHVLRCSSYSSYHDFVLFLILGVCNCLMYVLYVSAMVGFSAFSTKYLVKFQECRRRYNKYASREGLPNYLRGELMEHYKYLYKKLQTDEPFDLTAFYPNLCETIQAAMYEETLQKARIFINVHSALFRFVVPFTTERYYLIHATMLHCNDINSHLFIVKKGYAEVFIADQSVAVLSAGGMFGCFSKSGTSRATITVVAKVHADLLAIQTRNFYDVIQPYRQVVTQMTLADLSGVEYIEPYSPIEEPLTVVTAGGGRRNRKIHLKCHGIGIGRLYRYTFDDRNKVVMFYSYLTDMHIAPIVSIIAQLSIVIMNIDRRYIKYWAVLDAYFLLDMYMTCHIRTTDQESGLTTSQVSELTKSYLRSWKFYLDIFTLSPFYLFYRYMPPPYNGFLILNKCFRIINMFVYYKKHLRTRSVSNHLGFTFIVYILAFFLNTITAFSLYYFIVVRGKEMNLNEILGNYLFVATIYGNIGLRTLPVHTFTELMVISIMIIASQLLFVLINVSCCKLAIVVFFQDMDFRRAVITFKLYCHNEYVSRPIVTQCWKYLMYLYAKHGTEQFPKLIQDAPNYILEAHIAFVAKDLICGHSLFKNAHDDFLRQLMRYMKYEFIMPGFTIIEAGDKKKIIFFVAEGTVLSVTDGNEGQKKYELLNKGASFGEKPAIKGHCFLSTYKALTPVQLFGIRTKNWSYLLNWFPATAKTIEDASRDW